MRRVPPRIIGVMATTDAARGQVAAAAAEVYEEFFVPALFGQWAAPMLDAAGVAAGDAVLDVGCGTGVVARAAARRVGPTGEVVGLDRNDGMLAVAARSLEPVTWRQGVAERLPFDDGRFDRVLCQFSVMYFDDQRQGLREMARVLRPGGTVAIATWSAVEESPGYASMVDLLRRVVSDEAADALLAPFTLGTAKLVAELLADVFPDAAVTRHQGTARFESIRAWIHTDIRGWTLAELIDDPTYERLLTEALTVLAQYTDEVGRVRFAAPALIATAAKPS
jgi:ubiquinone/menaquinone biosynthesis C-methylase UbiE